MLLDLQVANMLGACDAAYACTCQRKCYSYAAFEKLHNTCSCQGHTMALFLMKSGRDFMETIKEHQTSKRLSKWSRNFSRLSLEDPRSYSLYIQRQLKRSEEVADFCARKRICNAKQGSIMQTVAGQMLGELS